MNALRLAVLASLLWSAAASAQSGGNVYLSQGKVFFQALDFERCVQRMQQAARWEGSSRAELAEIELYSGLCKFSLGQSGEAEEHFTLALQIDPGVQLPAGVSPRIGASFDAIASKVRGSTAPAQKPPAAKADREVVLVPSDAAVQQSTPVEQSLVAKPERKSRVLPLALGGVSVAAAVTGGVLSMARTLAVELARDGVTVNVVAVDSGAPSVRALAAELGALLSDGGADVTGQEIYLTAGNGLGWLRP